MQTKAEAVSLSFTAKMKILICCFPLWNAGQNTVKMTARKNCNVFPAKTHETEKKRNVVTHLAEFDWHQYHCTTEVTLFIHNALLSKWAEVINFIFFSNQQATDSVYELKSLFQGQFLKIILKKGVKCKWSVNALCNPIVPRFVSPTSSPTPCAMSMTAACVAPWPVSLSQSFSFYLLFIKRTFSELTQRKLPTSPSNARQISADLQ